MAVKARFSSLVLISVFISLSLLVPIVAAETGQLLDDAFTPEQQDTFEEVQGGIMSPYCPGRLLKDCPSSAARDLKFQIKSRILKGEDSEGILRSLIEEFGEDMRATPKTEGFGLLAWVVPGLFLLGGLIAILLFVSGNSRAKREPDHLNPDAVGK